jgi:hypothetical protein
MYIDLTGKKIGRWLVLKRVNNHKGRVAFLCRCECGTEREVLSQFLLNGQSKSCGCLNREKASERMKERNQTHGLSKTRLYTIWKNIHSRCLNKNNPVYKHYGGRGITLCDEWRDYKNFYQWSMSNGYKDDLTIDRIDVNGNYEPNNCRWADDYTQHNNTRKNVYVVYKGQRKTASQWSRELKISKCRLYRQLKNGKTLEEIINTPVRNHYLEVDGQKHTIAEWARIYDMPYDVVEARVNKYGWSAEKALTTPIRKRRKTK